MPISLPAELLERILKNLEPKRKKHIAAELIRRGQQKETR